MSDFLECSIPVSAINAQPYTIADIDDHPDRDRIWATIANTRKLVFDAMDEIDEKCGEAREDGYEDGRDDGYDDAKDRVSDILTQHQGSSDDLIDAIKEWAKK